MLVQGITFGKGNSMIAKGVLLPVPILLVAMVFLVRSVSSSVMTCKSCTFWLDCLQLSIQWVLSAAGLRSAMESHSCCQWLSVSFQCLPAGWLVAGGQALHMPSSLRPCLLTQQVCQKHDGL